MANPYFNHGRTVNDVLDKTLVDDLRTGFDLLDADTLRLDRHLSEFADPSVVRARLGITAGMAGMLDVGTTAGTVAEGDHTHGYLYTYNNLSDVDNVATARSNLGLGNVALLDVAAYGQSGGVVAGDHVHTSYEIPYESFIDYKYPELNLNINTVQKGIDYAFAYYQYLNAGGAWPPIYG